MSDLGGGGGAGSYRIHTVFMTIDSTVSGVTTLGDEGDYNVDNVRSFRVDGVWEYKVLTVTDPFLCIVSGIAEITGDGVVGSSRAIQLYEAANPSAFFVHSETAHVISMRDASRNFELRAGLQRDESTKLLALNIGTNNMANADDVYIVAQIGLSE